jgi:hypothetical protein
MRNPKVPWWPGSVKTGRGLHVHHLVFGIVLLLCTGFALALQPPSPWLEILAAGFGIGAGLTLDEYAAWLRLEDVKLDGGGTPFGRRGRHRPAARWPAVDGVPAVPDG